MTANPSDARPIALLDSGVGGLSILREVRRLLPAENLLYFADRANVPYGPRQLTEIRALTEGIVRFLLAHDAKTIVVACNAASAASLHYLRDTFPDVPSSPPPSTPRAASWVSSPPRPPSRANCSPAWWGASPRV
jgi:glutamate racemase